MYKEAILFTILFSFSGCGFEPLDVIKKGVFQDKDRVRLVGEVFDNWKTCKSTEWNVLKKTDDSAEVEYICHVNRIDDIVSTLNKYEDEIQASNQREIRALNIELGENIKLAKKNLCFYELSKEKLKYGFIKAKIDDKYYSKEEIEQNSVAYLEKLIELANRSIKNEFNSKNERDEEEKKLRKLSEIIYLKTEENHFYGASGLGLEPKKGDESFKIHNNLINCLKINLGNELPNSFPKYYNVNEGIQNQYEHLISDIGKTRDKLEKLNKTADFSTLKKINIHVFFDVNKQNFQIKKSYIELNIQTKNVNQIDMSPNAIKSNIYKNIDFYEEFINHEKGYKDFSKYFR